MIAGTTVMRNQGSLRTSPLVKNSVPFPAKARSCFWRGKRAYEDDRNDQRRAGQSLIFFWNHRNETAGGISPYPMHRPGNYGYRDIEKQNAQSNAKVNEEWDYPTQVFSAENKPGDPPAEIPLMDLPSEQEPNDQIFPSTDIHLISATPCFESSSLRRATRMALFEFLIT
ncbi:hypothetical protein CIHG_06051 [Coccidioides immitis H538.4]|uniref:Uncharacterized protein n=1 Tax=Coccidioides immitis H538.4 TaxID=396776 RepID=A0A0J8UJL8_COCIT|nr:hypothetical protein CIHG_06051 [Coccidioides immitis H538.4]